MNTIIWLHIYIHTLATISRNTSKHFSLFYLNSDYTVILSQIYNRKLLQELCILLFKISLKVQHVKIIIIIIKTGKNKEATYASLKQPDKNLELKNTSNLVTKVVITGLT
jgi:hypothetical protein